MGYESIPPDFLQVLRGPDLELPSALTGLSRLDVCYLERTEKRGPDGGQAQQLPAGGWLRSLRFLGVSIDILIRSDAVLREASALSFLCVKDTENEECRQFDWRSPAVKALFDWVGQQPTLSHVMFECIHQPSVFDSHAFAAQLVQLCHHRPALHIYGLNQGDSREEFLRLAER